ncbi:hypothetical protein HPB49_012420 [Dermacentor silvarum]|uniref:Uncharacterized protein n=1 Tax=Dermacentor silvarum TaxID=543639 RepID=A0ACB8E049_DERSI|nr:hypothetical protein HPB49_012420 [Dermacentor silvarum]
MPTTAELAKKIASLEALLNDKLDTLIDDLMARINIKLENLRLGEHVSLCGSVQFMSKELDTMKLKQEELVTSNKALLSRNEALKKRVADLEQYSRMNNVEIKGIPTSQGEDCRAILKRIGDAIELPILTTDIDTAHRVASRSNEKSIIVRFCSSNKKNEFIRKARRARLRTGFTGGTNIPIYVNDHLTIDNKKVFSKALALKKENKWKYLWTENCQIKARKTDDSKVYRIITESDLRIFT